MLAYYVRMVSLPIQNLKSSSIIAVTIMMNFAISDVEEATIRLLIYNFECDYWTGKFIEF